MRILLIFVVLLLSACGTSFKSKSLPDKLLLYPASFDDIADWVIDDHHEALEAFNKSCKRILSAKKEKKLGNLDLAGSHGDWHKVCKLGAKVNPLDAREFFEQHFSPYKVLSDKGHAGLFTGYHEPNLNGSFTKTSKYKYPAYKVPTNSRDKNLTREQIMNGALNGKGLEILYVDDYIELFFMEIQGSGRVHLENGKVVNLGFAAHNNHDYKAISNYMMTNYGVKRNQITAEFIKSWLRQDEKRAAKVMAHNKSYVFFQINKEGPIGAHNVQLTPERSLAIDNRYIAFGIPIWLETKDGNNMPFNKLLIAQDRGGAIKGVVRGDIFFGSNVKAGRKASIQKHPGEYYLLLPKHVKPCCLAGK